jgi:hypothetical protein
VRVLTGPPFPDEDPCELVRVVTGAVRWEGAPTGEDPWELARVVIGAPAGAGPPGLEFVGAREALVRVVMAGAAANVPADPAARDLLALVRTGLTGREPALGTVAPAPPRGCEP